MSKLTPEGKIALVIFVLGSLMRFYNYDSWSLSNDELSALTRLKYDTYAEMIEKGVRTNDMHPVGVQSFLWVWTHCLGISVSVVRLPFVLFGVLSIFLFYLTARNFFGKQSALMSTGVFAALQFPVLYAQLARPYSPGLFFSLLTVYAWSNIVWKDEQWNWKSGLLFILGGLGCMYSHYFSFLFAGIVGLTGFFFIAKTKIRHYLLCGFLMAICYIPNLNVFMSQFSIGGLGGPEGWLGLPESDALWKYMLFCLNDNIFLVFFLCISAVFFIFRFRAEKHWTTQHTVALVFFTIPALIAYFYSVFINPVFQYSILLFSFPFLIILLCSWFKPIQFKPVHVIQVFFVFTVTAYTTVFANRFYTYQFFAPFSDVAERCAVYTDKYKMKKVDATINVIHPDYINYYAVNLNPQVHYLQYLCNRPEHFLELKKLVMESKAQVFIHAWSNNYHAPETEMIIQEKFPYLVEKDSFFNAGVLVYAKDSTLNRVNEPAVLYYLASDFEDDVWTKDSRFKTDSLSFSKSTSMYIGESYEFSPGIKDRAENVGFLKGATFELKCRYYSPIDLKELKLVVSIDRNGESVIWRGYPLSLFPVKKGEWVMFYAGYKLTEDILPDDLVSVYFYNPSKEKVWIDDIEFRVLE